MSPCPIGGVALCTAKRLKISVSGGRWPTALSGQLDCSPMAEHVPEPVYLPGNEPYLGVEGVYDFDLAIPRAMAVHADIGKATFAANLSPLQLAATVIIPQGVSLALSVRELIRQAYLYPAAILLRPLVERTGMIQHLAMHPASLEAWQRGWPRKSQPSFTKLIELVMPDGSSSEHKLTTEILHKLVHTDPKGAPFNTFSLPDGSLAYAAGKELSQPKKAEAIALLASHCLRRLTATSVLCFGQRQRNPSCSRPDPGGAPKS